MSFIAAIRLSSPRLLLSHTMRAAPEITLETMYHAATSESIPYLFYAATGEEFENFEAALADDPSIVDATMIDQVGERRIYRMGLSRDQLLVVPRLTELGAAFLQAHTVDGSWHLKIRMPDRETLASFKRFCDEREIVFRLHRLYRTEDSGAGGEHGLTNAQCEALVTAYERGYFEEPREVSLREIGNELGVSSTAVGGRIRRGMCQLVESELIGGSDGT